MKDDTPDETEKTDKGGITGNRYALMLSDIQKAVIDNYLPVQTIGDPEDVCIKLHYPTTWSTPALYDYITTIIINNKEIQHSDIDDQQFNILLDNFPGYIISKMNKKVSELQQSIENTPYLKTRSGIPDIMMHHDKYIDIITTLYDEPLGSLKLTVIGLLACLISFVRIYKSVITIS